jgi:hypothetical protein
MRKHSIDLQEDDCQHIINTQNFYWEKDAVMKTVTDNFTINPYPAKVENMVSS